MNEKGVIFRAIEAWKAYTSIYFVKWGTLSPGKVTRQEEAPHCIKSIKESMHKKVVLKPSFYN